MPTIRLVPSSYSLSNTQYLSVANADNMYTNTDSTTYATVTNSQSGTTSYYIYVKGFNFSSIPSDATVTSFAVKFKASESGVSTSSTYRPYMVNNTTTITGTCSAVSTTATVQTFTGVTADWDTIKGYGSDGSDFGIRFNCRRAARNTTGYLYFYGAEIEVTYTVPNPVTVTTSLTGNGTISPSGVTNTNEGEPFSLTITPTNNADTVSILHDNVDVTSSLVGHHTSGGGTPGSISRTADSFTTGYSITGISFYTSSSSSGNNFNYAVGHTAESPGATSSGSGSWTYVKPSSGSTTGTGYADFSFDFSSIPENAEITSVQVKCYGAIEDSSQTTSHADITLYSGSTQKGTTQSFTSSANSIITISDPGTWARAELQNATLRFTVGYYGGHIFGITWMVNYAVYSGNPDYYTYDFTVGASNSVIAVTIGGSTEKIYLKVNGSWVECSKVYRKVSGSWAEQSDFASLFDTSANYVQG